MTTQKQKWNELGRKQLALVSAVENLLMEEGCYVPCVQKVGDVHLIWAQRRLMLGRELEEPGLLHDVVLQAPHALNQYMGGLELLVIQAKKDRDDAISIMEAGVKSGAAMLNRLKGEADGEG